MQLCTKASKSVTTSTVNFFFFYAGRIIAPKKAKVVKQQKLTKVRKIL